MPPRNTRLEQKAQSFPGCRVKYHGDSLGRSLAPQYLYDRIVEQFDARPSRIILRGFGKHVPIPLF